MTSVKKFREHLISRMQHLPKFANIKFRDFLEIRENREN